MVTISTSETNLIERTSGLYHKCQLVEKAIGPKCVHSSVVLGGSHVPDVLMRRSQEKEHE